MVTDQMEYQKIAALEQIAEVLQRILNEIASIRAAQQTIAQKR